ncbi:MAG: heme-binding protein [Hyphomonadaceae bacterium]
MRCAAIASFATVVLSACATTHVEEPSFTMAQTIADLEVRDYAPTVVAEVDMPGDALASRFSGFYPLADYIFAKDRAGAEIAMTAPVTQAPRETIAMTAPVTQQSDAGGWRIAFTMPASYSIATLPKPANPNVRLEEQPARRMAVIRFSGTADDAAMHKQSERLLAAVSRAGMEAIGSPVFAFYDPPWTLAFFRRNEVMVEVRR